MCRHLPSHPNLEHLKKQAKDRLDELQRQQPGSQFADALHAVAREYGFATWPTLKAHVEALSSPGAPTQNSPLVGHWTADLARSKRHPSRQFQSATLQFTVVGNSVIITDRVVEAWGQEERSAYTVQADGREYPSEHGNGYVHMARWRGSHLLETVAKKDGQVVGQGTYEVSADGKSLTVSARSASANADGWGTDFEQVIVLERSQ